MGYLNPPYAAESNPPIHPEYYQPSRFVISAITLGATTIVTTSVNHNYVVGQQVRLIIPFGYGSRMLNNTTPFVISIPSANQVGLNLYSLNSDAFNGSFDGNSDPQIVAIGDVNTGAINQLFQEATNDIPGSFINISPN